MYSRSINGNIYYYKTLWAGGRSVTTYVPRAFGELAGAIEALERAERQADAEAWRAERDALDDADREAAGRFGLAGAVAGAALEIAGYHRVKRGRWRRKRMKSQECVTAPAYTGKWLVRGEWPVPREEFLDVLTRASEGDESAMPRAREIFEMDPGRVIAICGGEISDRVEDRILEKLAGGNALVVEAIGRKLVALRAELAGPHPSAIERLLAERIALCWLDVHRLDHRDESAESMTMIQAEHMSKLRSRAHNRYISAIKALASVRRLDLVAIQVAIDARSTPADGRESC